ncbi:MAG: hypothetical protein AB1942_19970 [Pseudomonadota bacterium]
MTPEDQTLLALAQSTAALRLFQKLALFTHGHDPAKMRTFLETLPSPRPERTPAASPAQQFQDDVAELAHDVETQTIATLGRLFRRERPQ